MRNLSPSSQRSSSLMFKVLAVLSESFIYILFGVVAIRGVFEGSLSFSLKMVVVVFILVMSARGLTVFPSCSVLNHLYRNKLHCAAEADRKEAQASLRALLQPPHPNTHSAGVSATPYARSYLSPTERRISHDTVVTHQGSALVNHPATVIEEESYFSRQTSFRGRVQERLELIPVDSSHLRLSPPHWRQSVMSVSPPVQTPRTEHSPETPTRRRRVGGESGRHVGNLPLHRLVMSGRGGDEIYAREFLPDPDEELQRSGISKLRRASRNGGYLSLSCQMVFWLAGLRGAVSFALAMALPLFADTPESHTNIMLIGSTTLAIVLITTICLGFFVEVIAVKFGIVKVVGRAGSNDTLSPLSHISTPLLPETTDLGANIQCHPPHLLAAHYVRHLSNLVGSFTQPINEEYAHEENSTSEEENMASTKASHKMTKSQDV
eukprot:Gregarina_sp_Poly_1__3860@NODE_2151_length_2596_cov_125_640569_g1386_i0_p1_GENE_NODE_2151_length_2596_cov_125_640569_g1386_i0NODE_2151_length_2596_cov_125_640569_g1386_i0_p1_ORF_typecomplete_len436_score45_00Na_H_Exchanger/PF00999_21/0_02Na_H_Exchanger/PF00999_21/6_4e05DUF2106/PF09879_9/0_1DUF2106/PF09879_9/5e03_NODE_2151_length_2596_cov_125_640569_g1386_i011752482